MPTLYFKGKTFLQNYHHAVKFHNLVPKKDKSQNNVPSLDDNLVIHGDNLKALKALLPTHAGKIKCIYIDPPYNTGNESWIYNDNVASPMIHEWLGNVVARDDLNRHDKWCCMMYPRLTLLKELLKDDGVIFVSIDDNEVQTLKMLLDEIFGEAQFLGQIINLNNPKGRVLDKYVSVCHEYLLMYSKSPLQKGALSLDKNSEDIEKDYPEEDDLGRFRFIELRNTHREFGKHNRPNLFYPIYVSEKTGELSLKKKSGYIEVSPIWEDGFEGCWTWGRSKTEKEKALLIAKSVKNGVKIYRKSYAKGSKKQLKSIWQNSSFYTEAGQRMVNEIFNTKEKKFPSPKALDYVKQIIEMCTEDGDIILDSFAGSGTTGHAVLSLNKDDSGNRKFILVECEDYADQITAERLRRVIKGIPNASDLSLKDSVGGSFSFFELGEEIEMDKLLEGKNLPSFEDLAKYAFFTATGERFLPSRINKKNFYIGSSSTFEVFLMYHPDKNALKNMALNLEFAEKINNEFPKRPKLVFAPACFMEDYHLKEFNIHFSQLPFEIYRMAE